MTKLFCFFQEKLGEKGLVYEVFYKCLFELPKPNAEIPPPKCKTTTLRKTAFILLEGIIEDSPINQKALLKLLVKTHDPPKSKTKAERSGWIIGHFVPQQSFFVFLCLVDDVQFLF